MANYFSEGSDRQYIPPGAAGTVLTSNGPGVNPSWKFGFGEGNAVFGNYAVNPTSNDLILAMGPNSQIVTLPTAGTAGLTIGQEFTIIAGGPGYPITVAGIINGVSNYTLTSRYYAVTVIWTGTQYLIVSAYSPSAETVLADKWEPVYPSYFVQQNNRCPKTFLVAAYMASGSSSGSPFIDLALAP